MNSSTMLASLSRRRSRRRAWWQTTWPSTTPLPKQVVGGFDRPVHSVREMPCGDLVTPAVQGPAEPVDFGRMVVVLEVEAEMGDELDGDVGVADLVDGTDDFLSFNRPS